MLKYRIKYHNVETMNYQEVGLVSDELKVSLDSKLLSGVFNRSYNIQNNEIVSVLTPNVKSYKDIPIKIENITRTGYFLDEEKIEIKSISGVVNSGDSMYDEGEQIMLSISGISGTSCLAFTKPCWGTISKRYVQMPNGKIYYEQYGEDGKGYFDLDFYTYFDKNGDIIEDTSGIDSFFITVKYYIDNDIVTYQDFETTFSDNYRINEAGNVVLDIIGGQGNSIKPLDNYVPYSIPQFLSKFELERPSDEYIDVEKVVPARKYFFIQYKGKKYDLYFSNGVWHVDIEKLKLNDDGGCVEIIETIDLKFDAPLQYDYTACIDGYPTDIVIDDTHFLIQSEYRTSIDGDYLFVFTNNSYNLSNGEEMVVSLPPINPQEFVVNKDVDKNFFITYYGKRIYLNNNGNENDYVFTIAKYCKVSGDTEYDNAAYDEILDEFEVTLTPSEYRNFINKRGFKAIYTNEQGNTTSWYIDPLDETEMRYKAYKIGHVIEYGNNEPLYLSGDTKNYKFNVYRSVTIENVKYKTNISKEIYELSEKNVLDLPYTILANPQNRQYELTIFQNAPNWLICQPKINPYEYYMDFGLISGDNVNLISYVAEAPYVTCVSEIVNDENAYFFIKDRTFGDNYVPTIDSPDAQNLLSFEFGNEFRLFKKINYISFPIHLESKVANNLHQEEIVGSKFFQVEVDKAVNSIIDMEKDIYYPVISKSSGTSLFNVSEIRFNLHFRTRNLDTWKINDGIGQSNNNNWNVLDAYKRNNGLTSEDVTSSDLLYFLNFNEDDVFYQKSRIAKSFLRLSFYDSIDENTQNLLHMSTVFMDENLLYKKYISNINKDMVERSDEYTYKFYNDITESGVTTYCSVNTEPVIDKYSTDIDYTKDRLDCQFIIKNRYETNTSSEGYYLYMFKEYGTKLRPSPIYMKVEFNHAGQGKVIPFMLPTINKNNEITCMADDPNSYEITDELSDEDILNKFKLGIPLGDMTKYQYIKLEAKYDEDGHRYVYYLPENFMSSKSKSWNNNTMTLNLWELKIKDES